MDRPWVACGLPPWVVRGSPIGRPWLARGLQPWVVRRVPIRCP